MFVFRVEDVKKEWNGNPLFEGVNLEVQEGDRIALIGRNGVGKSTLLHILMGQTEPDGGRVLCNLPRSEWGSMEQETKVDESISLLQYVQSANPLLCHLWQEQGRLEACMGGEPQTGTNAGISVEEKYSDVIQNYLEHGGYDWELRVEKSLMQLRLGEELWGSPYGTLSGGQKTKAQFCRLMLKAPRLLILDEPTNHLDEESLVWLEAWLTGYRGTIFFTSHDRKFIDNIAKGVYDLTPNGTKFYPGGYRDYRRQKDIETRTQEALHERQQKEKSALEAAIQQYREWYEKGHNAASERDPYAKKKAAKNATRFKAKERSLERLEKELVDKPQDGFHMDLRLSGGSFDARTLLTVENVSFGYHDVALVNNARLRVERGDRIALTGPNGAGKTTFLKVLAKQLDPLCGEVRHHPRLQIGYFAQELEGLEPQQSVLESVLAIRGMTETYARTILASFLFRKDDVFKPIGTLSMGEKCRVAFLKLYFSDANLLVLDEPTNYLDIDSREQVEEVLLQYPGSFILVSHDRYLVEKAAKTVIALRNGECVVYQGRYSELREKDQQPKVSLEIQQETERLELRLTQLMSGELTVDLGETELLQEIRRVKSRLVELKSR